jgi:hypothetical protein
MWEILGIRNFLTSTIAIISTIAACALKLSREYHTGRKRTSWPGLLHTSKVWYRGLAIASPGKQL